MGIILDTNAVSAAVADDRLLQRVLLPRTLPLGRPSIPLPVIGEFCFGLLGSTRAEELSLSFGDLVANSTVLYPDLATAEHYAALRHELKVKGRPIPENDIWIAALARQHQLPIASCDAHFDNVDGIQRIVW